MNTFWAAAIISATLAAAALAVNIWAYRQRRTMDRVLAIMQEQVRRAEAGEWGDPDDID